MATVRMYRGHWVADYYDAKRRRRIERPEGHFEKAAQELQAAQVHFWLIGWPGITDRIRKGLSPSRLREDCERP